MLGFEVTELSCCVTFLQSIFVYMKDTRILFHIKKLAQCGRINLRPLTYKYTRRLAVSIGLDAAERCSVSTEVIYNIPRFLVRWKLYFIVISCNIISVAAPEFGCSRDFRNSYV